MALKCFKSILVAVFSVVLLFFFNVSVVHAQPAGQDETGKKEASRINPSKIILEHVADAHEFHFFNFNKKPVSIPLPVILYSPVKGWSVFMASKFEDGQSTFNGYRLLTEEYIEDKKLDEKVYSAGKIWA